MSFKLSLPFILIVISGFAAGCSNNTTSTDPVTDDEPKFIIIGEVQDFVNYITPSKQEIEFTKKGEKENFTHHTGVIDINENGIPDITVHVFDIKGIDRAEVLLRPQESVLIPYRKEMDFVEDEFDFIEGVIDFPVGRAITPFTELKPENFDWITSQYLFAIRNVRNTGWTPMGITSFGSSSYIPIQIDNKTGYIKIAFNFDVPESVPELRFEEVAFLKE